MTDPVITDVDTFTITSAEDQGGMYAAMVAVESSVVTLSDYAIGDGVIVDFGGQSYSLTWQSVEGMPACGATVTGEAPDWSSAPFCIIAFFGEKGLQGYYVYLQNAVTSPIQVKIKKAKQTPVKIPMKYLESDVYIVKVTGKSNEQRPGVDGADVSYDVTVSATYDDIVAAVNAGKIPILLGEPVLRDPVLRLVDIDTDTVDGATPKLTFGGAYFWQSDRLYGTCVVIYRTGEATCCRYDSSFVDRLKDVDNAMSDTSYNLVPNSVIKKYVDDHVAGGLSLGLTSAAVGQIAKITAVDASGVPTAWSPADMPSGGSSDLYVDFWPTGSEQYNGNFNGYQVELATDQTFDAIFDSFKAGNKIVARLYENESKDGSPTSSVDASVTGTKEFGAIHFQFVTANADTGAIAGFPFIGEAIMMIKMEEASVSYLIENRNVLPTPNADGTDNGKVPIINGTKWELKTPFVINAPLGSNGQYTLDKTYAQIREAVTAGNNPVVHFEMPDGSGTAVMPLVEDYGVVFVFRATISIDTGVEALIGQYIISINSNDKVIFKTASALSLNSDGNLTQQTMDRAPTVDMQIATKKYVDDKISDKELILSSSTAGSTKKFKLTIDDTGTLTASEITA